MKLTYLGDAHDHWKGSVFQYLQEGEILRNFLVDSMATDASPWNTANSKLYAHLLRIEESHLVQHDRTLFQEPSPWWPVRLIRKLAFNFFQRESRLKEASRSSRREKLDADHQSELSR
jgi:hypothetical protein